MNFLKVYCSLEFLFQKFLKNLGIFYGESRGKRAILLTFSQIDEPDFRKTTQPIFGLEKHFSVQKQNLFCKFTEGKSGVKPF